MMKPSKAQLTEALIADRIAGREKAVPFRYRDLGTMAVIGRSRAIADFGRSFFVRRWQA